jgi:hypothetical protein
MWWRCLAPHASGLSVSLVVLVCWLCGLLYLPAEKGIRKNDVEQINGSILCALNLRCSCAFILKYYIKKFIKNNKKYE